ESQRHGSNACTLLNQRFLFAVTQSRKVAAGPGGSVVSRREWCHDSAWGEGSCQRSLMQHALMFLSLLHLIVVSVILLQGKRTRGRGSIHHAYKHHLKENDKEAPVTIAVW